MVNFLLKLLLVSYLSSLSINVFASEPNYFGEHAKGWHWYDDPKEAEDSEAKLSNDPITEMNAVHATVQRALDKAVINPTKENVRNYIAIQNELSNHANQFNHNWQAVLLENPELNYSIRHPTNNLAKQVEYDQTHARDEKIVHELAKSYQIYFFYKSTCPYCQRFAPIVKDFSNTYGFNVLPITTDGISLSEFPDSYVDQGESQIYNVTVEPTLFLVNPTSHKAIRIATGLTSESEIKKNMMALVTHFDGDVQ
ncbi:MAG: conjugal transfer protein TraF [Gammaproteobacteria bacterium]